MIDWQAIDSVLLDMDGTLLDLHFDNHFWLEHVPLRYGENRGLTTEEAKAEVFPQFKAMEGTIEWYSVDYWSDALDLDIAALKTEVSHLIAIHPHVIEFLDALKDSHRRVVLVTNAHIKSLDLKMEHTQLRGHFHRLICSHSYHLPKEDPKFWTRLQQDEPFDPLRSLLIDDSIPVLKSAQSFGIAHLLAVYKPDSQKPKKDVGSFQAIHSFKDISPDSAVK